MLHLHHHHHHQTKNPRIDEKSDYPSPTTPTTAMATTTIIPAPELDLYRARITINDDGTRELDRLGAKSRWRAAAFETETREKVALLSKEKLGWFDKEKEGQLKGLRGMMGEFDGAKGEVLRGLGVRMEGFFGMYWIGASLGCGDGCSYFYFGFGFGFGFG